MSLRYFSCLLLVAVFCACKPDPKAVMDTPTPEKPASSVAFKNTDDVLRIAIRQPPGSLLPYMSTAAISRYVRQMIFQTLNSQDAETFAQVPQIASVADIRKEPNGGISYSYVIDESAKWPNGLPITAADVVFSLKVLMNPAIPEAGPYRSFYYDVESIITSPNNERRFRVVTRKPYLLAEQSIGSIEVLPEYAYDPDQLLRKVRLGDLTDEQTAARLADTDENLKAFAEAYREATNGTDPAMLVGSAPYRLESWGDGQKITLTRRDDYWGKDSKNPWMMDEVGQVVFDLIPDPQTTTNALRDELVDVALDLSISQFKQISEDDYLTDRYDVVAVPSTRYFGLLMNQRDPLFTDVKVRRAMAHLVDVDQLIEQLFPNELATRITGPVLEGKDYYKELPPIAYDPVKAEALLNEAGWTDTNGDGTLDKEINGQRTELSFRFLTFPTPESTTIGTLLTEWAAEAGVAIESVPTPPGDLYGAMNKGDFAMGLMGYQLEPNPDEFTQIWASTSVPPNGSNRGAFSNTEADQLIKRISTTLDADARRPLYERFQEIVYENQPIVFLVSPASRLIISKRFEYETSVLAPGTRFNAMKQREWNKKE
jgi:peptide/nickel transport system substrate-binding protein